MIVYSVKWNVIFAYLFWVLENLFNCKIGKVTMKMSEKTEDLKESIKYYYNIIQRVFFSITFFSLNFISKI